MDACRASDDPATQNAPAPLRQGRRHRVGGTSCTNLEPHDSALEARSPVATRRPCREPVLPTPVRPGPSFSLQAGSPPPPSAPQARRPLPPSRPLAGRLRQPSAPLARRPLRLLRAPAVPTPATRVTPLRTLSSVSSRDASAFCWAAGRTFQPSASLPEGLSQPHGGPAAAPLRPPLAPRLGCRPPSPEVMLLFIGASRRRLIQAQLLDCRSAEASRQLLTAFEHLPGHSQQGASALLSRGLRHALVGDHGRSSNLWRRGRCRCCPRTRYRSPDQRPSPPPA